MSSTPYHQNSSNSSASTSPTAIAVDFSGVGGEASAEAGQQSSRDGLRNRVHNKSGYNRVAEDVSPSDSMKPSAPLLSSTGTTTKDSAKLQAIRRRKKNNAAKRPTVDVRRLGHFKTKIGMLQDSRNLRFRKLYKAPDPIVVLVFIGSILLWYVLFNYIKTWR